MARVLGAKRALSLRIAEQSSQPEWLMLKIGNRSIATIPVLRRQGGLLLALPGEALTEEEIDQQSLDGVTEDLGPVGTTMVKGFADAESETEVEVAVLLLDWPQNLYKHLRTFPAAPTWPPQALKFTDGEEEVHSLSSESLVEAARAWVDEGEARNSDAYISAMEIPATEDNSQAELLQQVFAQMQATATVVTQLQADMAAVKAGAASSSAAPPQVQKSAVLQAQQLVGVGPCTRLPRKPAAAPLPQVDLTDEGDGIEELEEGIATEGKDTDHLLRVALVRLLSKEAKPKKHRTPGLPLNQSGSDSEMEEGDPLRRLAGAKGTLLLEKLRQSMEAEPAAYVAAMEQMAAQTLGEAAPGPTTMEKYVREELPMGAEKSLGYATWLMTRALTLMRAGAHEKAQLVLMLGIAAVEQYRLDGAWTSAWRLTQVTQPPFTEWRNRDAALWQLKQDHAHSRLVHPTWVAAVIARLKDEETLLKRRARSDEYKDKRPFKGGKGEKGDRSGKGRTAQADPAPT